MNHHEAAKLGRDAVTHFVSAYSRLATNGYNDSARAMILSTFPFCLASVAPNMRTYAMADVLEVYSKVGKEVFEDCVDLYDAITGRYE